MPTAAQPQPQPQPPQGRRSRWLLGVTGVVLLVVSIVMMATNAPASRAQTVHPGLAHTKLSHAHAGTRASTLVRNAGQNIVFSG